MFCEGNPLVTYGFPYKGPIIESFNVFFVAIWNKLLNEQLVEFMVIWNIFTVGHVTSL